MYVFPTIRHTGSHFVVGLFGFRVEHGKSWKHGGKGDFYFDHIHPALKDRFIPIIKEHTPIIPLRHPKSTWLSWQARKRDLKEFVETWRFLVEEVDPLHPHYLPIDSPNRDKHLAALNAALGTNLTTDWTPKGVKQNNQNVNYRTVNVPAAVESLCDDIQPFLARFY